MGRRYPQAHRGAIGRVMRRALAPTGLLAYSSVSKYFQPSFHEALMTKFDKSKLPSRYVTEGPSKAPHRSYMYAMGLSEEEIHQPLVGVATCWNEAAPCNIALSRQAQAVKTGVSNGYS